MKRRLARGSESEQDDEMTNYFLPICVAVALSAIGTAFWPAATALSTRA